MAHMPSQNQSLIVQHYQLMKAISLTHHPPDIVLASVR